LFAALTLSLLIVMGCSKESEPAKNPKAETTPAKEDTFTLDLPDTATNIAKGADEPVKITVDRGDDFKGDIALTFKPPEGITIEPVSATIPADADDVEVTVTAADSAGAGEKDIEVTGKAGEKVTRATFKVEVTDE
jgi:uncharacterized membrane protein